MARELTHDETAMFFRTLKENKVKPENPRHKRKTSLDACVQSTLRVRKEVNRKTGEPTGRDEIRLDFIEGEASAWEAYRALLAAKYRSVADDGKTDGHVFGTEGGDRVTLHLPIPADGQSLFER